MITYRDPVFCFVVLSNVDFCLSRLIILNLGASTLFFYGVFIAFFLIRKFS